MKKNTFIKPLYQKYICTFFIGLGCLAAVSGCSHLAELEYEKAEQQDADIWSETHWDTRLKKTWKESLNSLDSQQEKDMMKAAVSEALKYMTPQEKLAPGMDVSMNKDLDFPNEGIWIIDTTVFIYNPALDLGRHGLDGLMFGGMNIWVEAKGDGTYTVSNDFAKEILSNRLLNNEVEQRKNYLSTVNGDCGQDSPLKIVQRSQDSLFINYEDYENISDFFHTFGKVCQEMKETQDIRGMDLSQYVRFGEADYKTDMEYNKRFYPEHWIDFELLASNPGLLEELEQQVRKEQLDFLKEVQPERYQSVLNGVYLSREEYKERFSIGRVSSRDDGKGGSQVKVREMSKSGEYYRKYLKNMDEHLGRPVETISEYWPKYIFSSLEFDSVRSSGSYFKKWTTLYNDNYRISYPNEYAYGSNYLCQDVISREYDYSEKPFPEYTWDMEIPENRLWDMGRLYLYVFQGDVFTGDGPNDVREFLNNEKIMTKLDAVLGEPFSYHVGEYETLYHDFWYAKGETSIRDAAIYIPKMREGENFQWILLFEKFKDSEQENTLYENQEQIIQSFIIFPYWYECGPGDYLEQIAIQYTGDPAMVNEICKSPVNRIKDPDVIYAGQKIFLPPHVFLNN